MKPVDRQKMCLNCDGRVPFESIACPYCSTDLSRAPEVSFSVHKGEFVSKHQAIQDTLTASYAPPYRGKKGESTIEVKKERMTMPAHHGGMAAAPGSVPKVAEEEKTGKNILASILALSLGSLLFMIGILQVFFSSHGVLRLEWDAKHWFIYLLASLPILYYGYLKAEEKS